MKPANTKLIGLRAGVILTLASFGVSAGRSHMTETLKLAEAATKSAEEAVTHLKAAQ